MFVCFLFQWTVNGLLRIGFFTQRRIPAGTELTFDYQLQRYGFVFAVSQSLRSNLCCQAVLRKIA